MARRVRAMTESMTGFSCREAEIEPLGKITVELRSTNHKFLETVLHVPEGFLSLEEPIKKEIESRLRRGRVMCVISIVGAHLQQVHLNEPLVKRYLTQIRALQKRYGVQGDLTVDALLQLPGVVSLVQPRLPRAALWPVLRRLIIAAAEDLREVRRKEGAAMLAHIYRRSLGMRKDVDEIKARFHKAIAARTAVLSSDEERSSFLKNADITEEIDRVSFHVHTVLEKLSRGGPLGKELDFTAQEMQREINTIGAKSCDAAISAKVVEIKSTIEKIREQAQNIA